MKINWHIQIAKLCLYSFVFGMGFHYVALESLELSIDQASIELTETHLPLHPQCWGWGLMPQCPANATFILKQHETVSC